MTNEQLYDKINTEIAEAIFDGDGTEELMRERLEQSIDSLYLRQSEDYVNGAIKLALALQS